MLPEASLDVPDEPGTSECFWKPSRHTPMREDGGPIQVPELPHDVEASHHDVPDLYALYGSPITSAS